MCNKSVFNDALIPKYMHAHTYTYPHTHTHTHGRVALLDCIFTNIRKPWFIEPFWNCRSLRNSFLCNVLQDGSEQRHWVISIIHIYAA